MMGVLRMIKMFGWEQRVNKMVYDRREKELDVVWRRELLELPSLVVRYYGILFHIMLANTTFRNIVPLIHMVVTYATFVCSRVYRRQEDADIVIAIDYDTERASDW